MSESESHKRAKRKAAGKSGEIEKRLKGNLRLDACTKNKAIEVERSGTSEGLNKAALRLKNSGKRQKVLLVPQKDMNKAEDAMTKVGTSGTIKNLSGTKRRPVKKK